MKCYLKFINSEIGLEERARLDNYHRPFETSIKWSTDEEGFLFSSCWTFVETVN